MISNTDITGKLSYINIPPFNYLIAYIRITTKAPLCRYRATWAVLPWTIVLLSWVVIYQQLGNQVTAKAFFFGFDGNNNKIAIFYGFLQLKS